MEEDLVLDGKEQLSDMSCKLMNKLNEEESKLRQKSNLEIGTWSNEMAADSDNGSQRLDKFNFVGCFEH